MRRHLPTILTSVFLSLAVILISMRMGGCAPLPANPTQQDINNAVNVLAAERAAADAAIAVAYAKNSSAASRAKIDALDADIGKLFDSAYADALAGRNVDAYQLERAVAKLKRDLAAVPSTQP